MNGARDYDHLALGAGVGPGRRYRKPLSPHWLRHTFGTLTALAGAGVFSIQEAMGHAQITTSQRYVHWAGGLADSAAHKLPIEIT